MSSGFNTVSKVGLPEIGTSIVGRAVTQTLYVTPNGNGDGGLTWANAFTTIQDALNAASTDADECTLIVISNTHPYYDIDTAGDPTWTGNYVLRGVSRSWAEIRNTHASATSIIKFTGNVMLSKLNFNLGTGTGNGVIITHEGFRVADCIFIGEDLTGAATALHIDGNTAKYGKIKFSTFAGHVSYMTGVLLDNAARNRLTELRISDCLTGIQIVHADSDENIFEDVDIVDCALAVDFDAGNKQHISGLVLHNNTVNIDDEVGDHIWQRLCGPLSITIEPATLTGVQVDTAAGADTWGTDTELRAAATSTKPFRVIAVYVEPSVSEWYRLRLSSDSGSTFFDESLFAATKVAGLSAPSGTEFIFNQGTRISASVKSTSGSNNVKVWLELQEV